MLHSASEAAKHSVHWAHSTARPNHHKPNTYALALHNGARRARERARRKAKAHYTCEHIARDIARTQRTLSHTHALLKSTQLRLCNKPHTHTHTSAHTRENDAPHHTAPHTCDGEHGERTYTRAHTHTHTDNGGDDDSTCGTTHAPPHGRPHTHSREHLLCDVGDILTNVSELKRILALKRGAFERHSVVAKGYTQKHARENDHSSDHTHTHTRAHTSKDTLRRISVYVNTQRKKEVRCSVARCGTVWCIVCVFVFFCVCLCVCGLLHTCGNACA